MFCKKLEDAIRILDSEIKLTHGIFLDSLELAKKTSDETDRKEILRFANECSCRYEALKELRTKYYEELGL